MQHTHLVLLPLLLAFAASADDRSVDFDPQADFSQFRTFAFNRTTVNSNRPELAPELVKKKIADALRTELAKKGLTEDPQSDLIVNYRLGAANRARREVWTGPWGGVHTATYHFTEGTLVVDLVRRQGRALVWRGIYRDDEKKASKLSTNLPKNVQKLMDKYPPAK